MARIARKTAGALVVIAALCDGLLIRDVHTAMAYSNSFTLLSADVSAAVFYASIAACAVAAVFSVVSAIADRSKRVLSLALLACSLALTPAVIFYGEHIANTTVPAVREQ